ncbi:MAG: response regulator transcription factor [Candidatus Didemnitutus sp.]|nr:response regulator transcription factor [Candidatus Didemnitutus sp.]
MVQAHEPCRPRLTLAIADECPALREGLVRLVGDECDLAAVDSAATPNELKALVLRRAPQVVVMDLMLGEADGLALIKELGVLAPDVRIVVFTLESEDVYALRAFRAGARAFISKRDAVTSLFRAVREVAAGRLVVPAIVSSLMFADSGPVRRTGDGIDAQLTDRELQVFRLVGLPLPTRVIAERLGVSVKTVETHRENIKNKLALDSHQELLACASTWLRERGT